LTIKFHVQVETQDAVGAGSCAVFGGVKIVIARAIQK
jgi:hypothetical protein